ncbi:MAG: YicC family protein [Deferribacteraceae bacterium]|jgi:uncharacterized protein (TIGR00255 family)|nr:YicC family protein [Deferribacteraceae bacterium]
MLKSMTGFGRTVASNELCDIKVEIKSINSKYNDITVRLPRVLSAMEIPIRSIVQDKLVRGKIDVSIEARFNKPVQTPVLNRQQYVSSMNVLEQMKTLGGLNDEITLSHLLGFADLVEYSFATDLNELENLLKTVVSECADDLDRMRIAEGSNLRRNIIIHLNTIDQLAKRVDAAKDDIFMYWVDRFKVKVAELVNSSDYNDRIIQEAAIYAEKADIKEELARIFSHQQQFRGVMDIEFPCGKKLDFLCQEMYREWNTIASKSSKVDIINAVVEAKSAVDSIREQIQNIV